MSTEISLAIIAAIASLIVASISLITAIISNRHSARAAQQLEAIRHSFARASTTEAISDKEFAQTLEALKTTLAVIQRLKDELQLILSAVEDSLDTDVAIKRFSLVRQELFDTYEKHYAHFNEIERNAFHKAKNMSLQIENSLIKDLAAHQYASELNEQTRANYISLRYELGDLQRIISDSKTDRFIARTNL